ncbi:MAG TPA: prolyl oligopeptidase family serine peptidase [Patescibacteria group bacterium]
MKIWQAAGIVITVAGMAAGGWYFKYGRERWADPKGAALNKTELNLTRYDFNELKKRGGIASDIQILGSIPEIEKRRKACKGETCLTKNEAKSFETHEISFESEGRKISGMMNLPLTVESRKRPAIIMIRGYADRPGYYVGFGSYKAADKLAANGYVTVSLDFLSYGHSDQESMDLLEARFEKVVSTLDLIESVKKLPYVDPNKIGIWAHSNGGQIALSVLEVTGDNYPTTLWAPMTNPFPESVLDTANGLDDNGKLVVKTIADFEKHYDSRRYAFENYYDWVRAPVQIHQGTADAWCKVDWQQNVVNKLREFGQTANLYIYQGDDHNFGKSWKELVGRDLVWFKEKL